VSWDRTTCSVWQMEARLNSIKLSHPGHAARLMLEHKGIDYALVNVPAGMQAAQIRLAGFKGGTVPALRIDGHRALGTLAISRLLDEIQPEPPLFPAEPSHRRAVEEAEAWGERVLQPIPRRLLRWALRHRHAARMTFARELGMPLPQFAAVAMTPGAAFYARREQAGSTERIRRDWDELPGHLDHVDELIAAGTIGGRERNAADYQIGTTLRVILACADFESLIAGRPAEDLARGVWPHYSQRMPPMLPPELTGAISPD
jgi:glutathione S-transferase